MIKVVITHGFRWNYFQWFLLGLHELDKQGKIELSFKLPIGSKLLSKSNNKAFIRLGDKLRRTFESDSYNMDGYIILNNGMKRKFTIDSADAPYLFDNDKLKVVDVYFKMQCPKSLSDTGFNLTDEITIPWLDHNHVDKSIKNLTDKGERKRCKAFSSNKHKVKPLIVGPRALSDKGFSYELLKKGYDNYIKDRKEKKNKRIMCYFGNALGPAADSQNKKAHDFDWEADIMEYYKDKVNHPNEKRAIVSEIINSIPNCDGRVISVGNADTGIIENKNLIIPLKDFCKYISDFQYNTNVSGYRLSMPGRFIESFMVGTGVITDKLSIKWYKPFGCEVYESVPMGYLPMKNVEWDKYKEDLSSLPQIESKNVIKAFEEKWAPEKVASYIIDTIQEG